MPETSPIFSVLDEAVDAASAKDDEGVDVEPASTWPAGVLPIAGDQIVTLDGQTTTVMLRRWVPNPDPGGVAGESLFIPKFFLKLAPKG